MKSVAVMLIRALRHMHSRGVVHNNIRPSNIFYDEAEGNLLLGNFSKAFDTEGGAAAAAASLGEGGSSRKRTFQQLDCKAAVRPQGRCASDWPYQAPELLEVDARGRCLSKDVDARTAAKSDMWSIGCVLVEMLMGAPLYSGTSAIKVKDSHNWRGFRDMMNSTVISRSCKTFVAGLLNKNSKLRFSSDDALNHEWLRPVQERRTDPRLCGFASFVAGGESTQEDNIANIRAIQDAVNARAAETDDLFESVYADVRRRALCGEEAPDIRTETAYNAARRLEALEHDVALRRFRAEIALCINQRGLY